MRFLVTGCPGSGTRYVSQVYQEVGVDCGHEQAFKYGWPDGTLRIAKAANQGEVSWYAAPFLRYVDMPTAHVVRHPLLNIRTLVGMEYWRTNPQHTETFRRYVPRVFEHTEHPVLWATRFWLDWNRHCELAETWNVHDLNAGRMFWLLRAADVINVTEDQLAYQLKRIPKTSAHNYGYTLDWSDLGQHANETKERAARYGLEGENT